MHVLELHRCHSQEDFPEYETITIGELKFGLCHGHQIVPWGDTESLQILQRKVLVRSPWIVADCSFVHSWTVTC